MNWKIKFIRRMKKVYGFEYDSQVEKLYVFGGAIIFISVGTFYVANAHILIGLLFSASGIKFLMDAIKRDLI